MHIAHDNVLSADDGFSCTDCGSPSIEVVGALNDDATVICGRCQRPLCTWKFFCKKISEAGVHDPIVAFDDWLRSTTHHAVDNVITLHAL